MSSWLHTSASAVLCGFRSKRRGLLTVVFFSAVLVVAYWPVLFGGNTLSTASYTVGTNGFEPFPGQETVGIDCGVVFLDCGASAWQFEPWAEVTNEALWEGELPLWNPYQGGGVPLAANAQSAVFDPLLLPVNLFPSTWLWDLTALGALLFGAIGFLAFGRLIGLNHVSAGTMGVAYALSGFFFLHANNGFIRTYAYLPVLLAAVEWCLRRRDALPVAAIAGAVAGCLLVGMPEAAFLVLLAVGGYALWRLIGEAERLRNAVRLLTGALLGSALAAPMLLPFAEYVELSHSLHTSESGSGERTEPARLLLGWVVPFVDGQRWGTRSWVGAAVLMLGLVGLVAKSTLRRRVAIPCALIAFLTILKVVGFPVIELVGRLPIFERVNFEAWAPPIVAAMFAVLAGLGVEAFSRGQVGFRQVTTALAIFLVLVGWGVSVNDVVFSSLTNLELILSLGLALGAAAVVVAASRFAPSTRISSIMLLVVVAELLILAPFHHYADRSDPYRPDDWLGELVDLDGQGDGSRLFAVNALLFPNTAGVFGLSDIRMLDALYVDRYWRYVSLFVEPEIESRFVGGPFGVSEEQTRARIVGNPMFDLLGVDWIVAGGEIMQTPLQERLESSIQASPALRGGYMDLGQGWRRYAFFQHAPNRTTIPLEPPLQGVLSFRYGLDRASFKTEGGSDGVTFGVDVVRASGAMEHLWSQNVEPGRDEFIVGWNRHSLVVEHDPADPVHELVLLTEPIGHTAMDWAGWIDLEFNRIGDESLTARFLDSIDQTPELRGAFMWESSEQPTRALFQHTPGDLELPIEEFTGGVLSFRYGLDFEAMDPAAGSDGVRFAVEVESKTGDRKRLWSTAVVPELVDDGHRWESAEVRLEGDTTEPPVGVWLLTEPIGHTAMDWAGWTDLELISPDDAPLVFTPEESDQLAGPVIKSDIAVVYENTHAVPRALVVHDVHAVSSVDAAEAWFREHATVLSDQTVLVDGIDPTKTAVIETDDGLLPAGFGPTTCTEPGSARIVDQRLTSVRVEVSSACPGLLLLADVYMPGWTATVDGGSADVYPTDIAFRGVSVPAGNSVVEFSYRPASFRNGVLLMLTAVIVLLGLTVRDRRRRVA